ncbi:DUF4252 domain-containing protein [Psychroflexus sp. ALD_RP9]|uniref:DUF4252 domain-containing protein n=1 Tax=Psychroflexus sp. ALD_RP9 TaxID=2777186 RepID=UPI001A905A4A|nr:DUF4252 domain-containing protein [Psychroflexus sp. ALD_RP9]QSS97226.1 DUF4252 domain-containing protein [Psychroflexus sp. ALD_RP9]
MKHIITTFCLLILVSCSNKQSLQEYLISKDKDANFKTMSVATDLLVPNIEELSAKEQATLKKIKSINVAAMIKDTINQVAYEDETRKVEAILDHSTYQTLMKMNADDKGMNLLYIGDDNKIDEVVFYGKSDEAGMLVARLNSRDLKPNDLAKLLSMADKLDMSQVENFTKNLK